VTTHHSPRPSAEVKNEWIYTSISSLHLLMVRCSLIAETHLLCAVAMFEESSVCNSPADSVTAPWNPTSSQFKLLCAVHGYRVNRQCERNGKRLRSCVSYKTVAAECASTSRTSWTLGREDKLQRTNVFVTSTSPQGQTEVNCWISNISYSV
jgi:hypothetical protein